jgi:N-acetylglucosamine malate deacetylase 1
MKLFGFDRVLCLSPHPDDVEYSMSGTIKRFKDTVFDIFCLSCGTSTDISSSYERIKEVQLFWKTSGMENINLIMPESMSLDNLNQAQLITLIENTTIRKHKYDALFVPSGDDSHYEHRLVNDTSMALVRNKPISVFEYRTSSSLHSWMPDLFIDIDSYYAEKISILRSSFKSQIDSIYFEQENLELFHKDFISNKKTALHRELFKTRIIYT